jgi:hypothetical protein
MFIARWIGPMCRNAAVNTRHHSPKRLTPYGHCERASNTGDRELASGEYPFEAAETAVTRNIATLIAIRVRVTAPHRRPAACSPLPRRGPRTEACPARTHSGHWKPTDAGTMHSGQIGRPQRVQEMPVGRSGCR